MLVENVKYQESDIRDNFIEVRLVSQLPKLSLGCSESSLTSLSLKTPLENHY